jgi:hypothetical protein
MGEREREKERERESEIERERNINRAVTYSKRSNWCCRSWEGNLMEATIKELGRKKRSDSE